MEQKDLQYCAGPGHLRATRKPVLITDPCLERVTLFIAHISCIGGMVIHENAEK